MLSVLSVSKRLSTDCKCPVHRCFVSLTVFNTFFATFRYKKTINMQIAMLHETGDRYCFTSSASLAFCVYERDFSTISFAVRIIRLTFAVTN